jgi:hypothetical protein
MSSPPVKVYRKPAADDFVITLPYRQAPQDMTIGSRILLLTVTLLALQQWTAASLVLQNTTFTPDNIPTAQYFYKGKSVCSVLASCSKLQQRWIFLSRLETLYKP